MYQESSSTTGVSGLVVLNQNRHSLPPTAFVPLVLNRHWVVLPSRDRLTLLAYGTGETVAIVPLSSSSLSSSSSQQNNNSNSNSKASGVEGNGNKADGDGDGSSAADTESDAEEDAEEEEEEENATEEGGRRFECSCATVSDGRLFVASTCGLLIRVYTTTDDTTMNNSNQSAAAAAALHLVRTFQLVVAPPEAAAAVSTSPSTKTTTATTTTTSILLLKVSNAKTVHAVLRRTSSTSSSSSSNDTHDQYSLVSAELTADVANGHSNVNGKDGGVAMVPAATIDDPLTMTTTAATTSGHDEPSKAHDPPFALLVTQLRRGNDNNYSNSSSNRVCIVLASLRSLTVYIDVGGEVGGGGGSYCKFPILLLPSRLTALELVIDDGNSSNNNDSNGASLACGLWSGAIVILHNVLQQCSERASASAAADAAAKTLNNNTDMDLDKEGKSSEDEMDLDEGNRKKQTITVITDTPTKSSILMQKLHWHAHSVSSLAYDARTGMLYSGGDEAVLIAWQLHRGRMDKPTAILPRVAIGRLRSLVLMQEAAAAAGDATTGGSSSSSVLVHCSDDASLQRIQLHDFASLWKVQGLALSSSSSVLLPEYTAEFVTSAAAGRGVLVSALQGVPGTLQWLDGGGSNRSFAVTRELVVVPYNRITANQKNSGHDLPAPQITHCCLGGKHSSNRVLITVDVVPTENLAIGKVVRDSGTVTTIRFWNSESSTETWLQNAAMTYPHGSANLVSSVALSPDGLHCVTVSNDEKAFRLWTSAGGKRHSTNSSSGSNGNEWMCRCKVSIPAGYADFECRKHAASFSSDASVAAIAFGEFVTLWDVHEVTFLTALRHIEEVERVLLLNGTNTVDLLLIQSKSCVALKSPYPSGPAGWVWSMPGTCQTTSRVSCVAFLPRFRDMVAIAQYYQSKDESRVILVDAVSGEVCRNRLRDNADPVTTGIRGEVLSLSAATTELESKDHGVVLHMLTSKNEVIRAYDVQDGAKATRVIPSTLSDAPALPLLVATLDQQTGKKRKVEIMDARETEISAPSKSLLMAMDELQETGQLPLLRGAFSRTFVGRNLQRHV
jgi:hypothetical protein